jgi:hypothetical protein
METACLLPCLQELAIEQCHMQSEFSNFGNGLFTDTLTCNQSISYDLTYKFCWNFVMENYEETTLWN